MRRNFRAHGEKVIDDGEQERWFFEVGVGQIANDDEFGMLPLSAWRSFIADNEGIHEII